MKQTSYLVHTKPRADIRTRINPPPRVAAPSGGESMTRQSFKDETNINNIMAKYTRTGLIDHMNSNPPLYGEVPGVDFREALALVEDAEKEFLGLPGEVRKRFDNDPAKYLDFFKDPENREEAVALGLLEAPSPAPPPAPETPPAEVPPSEGD